LIGGKVAGTDRFYNGRFREKKGRSEKATRLIKIWIPSFAHSPSTALTNLSIFRLEQSTDSFAETLKLSIACWDRHTNEAWVVISHSQARLQKQIRIIGWERGFHGSRAAIKVVGAGKLGTSCWGTSERSKRPQCNFELQKFLFM